MPVFPQFIRRSERLYAILEEFVDSFLGSTVEEIQEALDYYAGEDFTGETPKKPVYIHAESVSYDEVEGTVTVSVDGQEYASRDLAHVKLDLFYEDKHITRSRKSRLSLWHRKGVEDKYEGEVSFYYCDAQDDAGRFMRIWFSEGEAPHSLIS